MQRKLLLTRSSMRMLEEGCSVLDRCMILTLMRKKWSGQMKACSMASVCLALTMLKSKCGRKGA